MNYMKHAVSASSISDEIYPFVIKTVRNIWKEVFSLRKINEKTDFIELGGDSLTAIRIIARINETFNLNLPASFVFEYPNVVKLSRQIKISLRPLHPE